MGCKIVSYNICISCCILLHLCQSFLVNFISFQNFLEIFLKWWDLWLGWKCWLHSYQFLIIRHPGYEVSQLIVVHSPGLDQLLQELVCPPQNQQNSWKEMQIWIYTKIDGHIPERNKVENNGDDEDNNKGQPGEERNTEVKDILCTLQDMSQESKVTLKQCQ